MLGLVDPQSGSVRMGRLIALNLVAIIIVAGTIALEGLPLYPWAVAGYVAVFILDVLALTPHLTRGRGGAAIPRKLPKSLWFAALLFTPLAGVAIIKGIRSRDLSSEVQAAIGFILVSYIWLIIYRLSRPSKRG